MTSNGVHLEELVFTQSWEDPDLDREAFALGPGARVATVGSGGCNALTFLLDDPAHVLAFDYNPTQVWVLELKVAAFRALDHAGLLELLGVSPSSRRAELLARCEPSLSEGARLYWRAQPWLVERGLLNGGRYERFVARFQRVLRLVQGRSRIESLFSDRTLDERRDFYEREWNHWRWRLLFRAFFNKRVLARRGLSADYFRFDDGSTSFAENFAKRAARALVDRPVRENPYLAQYVLGRYLGPEALPEHLRAESFERIRERIDRLEPVHADVRTVFDCLPEAAFDAICLSNVFELMSEDETGQALARAARALRPGGRLTLRNLMIPREVPVELRDELRPEERLSRSLHARDRSFVYRSFQVYTRRPARAA